MCIEYCVSVVSNAFLPNQRELDQFLNDVNQPLVICGRLHAAVFVKFLVGLGDRRLVWNGDCSHYRPSTRNWLTGLKL